MQFVIVVVVVVIVVVEVIVIVIVTVIVIVIVIVIVVVRHRAVPALQQELEVAHGANGQFSKFHVCFCGLYPGGLKFETVRTNKQHICF